MRLYNQAEAYKQMPSEILRLETPWGAWQVNEITLMIGRRMERNVSEGKDAADGLMNLKNTIRRGYKSLKGLVTKKVNINPDGTW